MARLFPILVFLVSLGCAGCGGSLTPVQISPDTYMITKQDNAGVFGGGLTDLKIDVMNAAKQFAESQDKVAIPLSIKEHPLGVGIGGFASIEYQFRVVDKSDPEARRTHLVPRPDFVLEKNENIKKEEIIKKDEHVTTDTHTKVETDKPSDLYTELMKLDDLRKRGLLTEEEFQEQKRKLLEGKK